MNYLELIKWFGPIGLILDITGAVLIFKYGLPEEISRNGNSYRISEQDDSYEKEKAKKYDKVSKLGFRLLILGFILQLISSLNSICNEH